MGAFAIELENKALAFRRPSSALATHFVKMDKSQQTCYDFNAMI